MKYDDASWHFGGDFPAGLPPEAGATHIAMFLSWAVLSELAGEYHNVEATDELGRLQRREVTPTQWFLRTCDEKFTDEDLNDEGNSFAASYYGGEEGVNAAFGSYIEDYCETFPSATTLYEVEDSWVSFDATRTQASKSVAGVAKQINENVHSPDIPVTPPVWAHSWKRSVVHVQGGFSSIWRKTGQSDDADFANVLPFKELAPTPWLAQRCDMDRDTSPSLRSMEWSHIVERYRFRKGDRSANIFSSALDGIERLAVTVADGPLSSKLFGWVSMFELCIQQTDAIPYSAPYLRVSPLASGAVEFRYFDTAIPARQWHREVPPEATVPRFEAFIDQLNWIAV